MTGDVVLLNGCLASGACVDITVRDGVIHETGDTEATGGAPERDVRFAPDYVRFTPKSGHSEAHAGLPVLTQRRHIAIWVIEPSGGLIFTAQAGSAATRS